MFDTKRLMLVTLAASLAIACEDSTGPNGDHEGTRVVGSGVLTTTVISVDSFRAIKARGVARVVLTPGTEEAVTVTAEDNLLPFLWAHVEDGVLLLGRPDTGNLSIHTHHELLFEVGYREVDAFDLQGVLTVDASGIASDSLNVVVGGVSTFEIAGTADKQVVSVDGVTNYSAADLETRITKITGNGVMEVVLNVSEELFGNVCGAGSVRYIGTPALSVTRCPAVSVSRL